MISFPASQSLHASTAFPASGRNALPTGLSALDEAISLCSPDAVSDFDEGETKGLPLGHVTEVFGPPGAGKTALAWVFLFFLPVFLISHIGYMGICMDVWLMECTG